MFNKEEFYHFGYRIAGRKKCPEHQSRAWLPPTTSRAGQKACVNIINRFSQPSPMSKKPIFKVIFHNQGKVYEIYARNVSQGSMFGFVEVEKIVFGEKSSVVLDPSEENLKSEFRDVNRTYIPLHAVIRIDEVSKQGVAKAVVQTGKAENVMPFPIYTQGGEEPR